MVFIQKGACSGLPYLYGKIKRRDGGVASLHIIGPGIPFKFKKKFNKSQGFQCITLCCYTRNQMFVYFLWLKRKSNLEGFQGPKVLENPLFVCIVPSIKARDDAF